MSLSDDEIERYARHLVLREHVSVWLKADLPVLMQRVRRRSNRPLLKTGDPEATMRRLMQEREPVYAEADVTVASREGPHEVVAQDVIDAVLVRFGERAA